MVLSPHSSAWKWKGLTLAELKGFISCILNMGLERRPTIAAYWYTTASQYCPWFHDMFPRDRIQLILNFFHMVDNKNLAAPGEPGYDTCTKFQPLADHANTVFRHYYCWQPSSCHNCDLCWHTCHSVICGFRKP
jgi:hypothetical protein